MGTGRESLRRSMNEREREHFDIACRFGRREFSRAEFRRLYKQVYGDSKLGSMLPADYCVNPRGGRYAIGTEHYPKFLRWLGPGRYQLTEDAFRDCHN